MKRRGVFLDRDGTLIRDKGAIGEVTDVIFYKHTIPALQKAQKSFDLFIITNQPGVAKGTITEEQVDAVNRHITTYLAAHGVILREIVYCPHRTEDGCRCKKPKPYLLLYLADRYSIDLSSSYVVGDHPSDIELACSVNATGIYVLSGHGRRHLTGVGQPGIIKRNIQQAINYICGKG